MIPVDELYLDEKNPRLRDMLDEDATQDSILKVLWTKMAVDELAYSIASGGFLPYEPLFAERDGARLVVVEGNRRLAAVKLLRSEVLRKRVGATDLPVPSKASRATLEKLPVIVCDREDVWQWIGFKHVNGPQVWQSFAKAAYIAWVKDELGASLKEIAAQIGDRHSTVSRLYRGYCVIKQAEKAKLFDLDDRAKTRFAFSHLYTGLDYPGIQKFIGLSPKAHPAPNPIPRSKFGNLRELLVWLYGSKSLEKQPKVQSQNPDLRELAQALENPRGVVALRRDVDLKTALRIAIGEQRLFGEALQQAAEGLRSAVGLVLEGYNGNVTQFDEAESLRGLAGKLLADMQTIRSSKPKRKV